MKKKLIIYLSIIIVVIAAAITLIVVFTNNKKNDDIHEISLSNYGSSHGDNVELNFGKHKAMNFNKGKSSNEQPILKFDVDSGEDFYNDVIKKHELYNAELDFVVENRGLAYGYIVVDNCIFHYEVYKKNVIIEACYGTTYAYELEGIHVSGNEIILGHFFANIKKSELECEEKGSYDYFSREFLGPIPYDGVLKIYSYIDEDICDIVGDVIYLKGLFYDYDHNKHITENYFVTISNIDGKATLSLI